MLGTAQPNMRVLANVTVIVIGVIVASIGEIKFVLIGVIFCLAGVVFESSRLAMVDRLLKGSEFKMDPMVSLYYFAPVCACMNGVVALLMEVPLLSTAQIYDLGLFTLLANASIAFMLNLAVVFLVCFTLPVNPLLALNQQPCTNFVLDRKDFCARPHPFRCAQGYPSRRRFNGHLW